MRALGTAAVLAISAASASLLLGSGVAQAGSTPNVVGQKYSDAETAISGAGMTAVVSTTVGDQLSRGDCQVVNQVSRTAPPPENSGGSATNELLVSLNCDAAVASATKPGFSAASPEGMSAAAAASSSAAAASASSAAAAAPAG